MRHIVKETDPILQMKEYINQLNEIENPTEDDTDRVEELYEKLTNLVCDMDFALDFCKLDGLDLVKKFLVSFSSFSRKLIEIINLGLQCYRH